MKALRKTCNTDGVPHEIEIYDARLDNLVRIENQAGGVTIRATRARPSQTAEEAFVRYLASEGFIAETYRLAAGGFERGTPGIRWVTDGSWVRFHHRRIRLTTRIWTFLTWGRLLSLALFLAALTVAIWFKRH